VALYLYDLQYVMCGRMCQLRWTNILYNPRM